MGWVRMVFAGLGLTEYEKLVGKKRLITASRFCGSSSLIFIQCQRKQSVTRANVADIQEDICLACKSVFFEEVSFRGEIL